MCSPAIGDEITERFPSGKAAGSGTTPYRESRYNSLRYGVMLDGVLPSRGRSCVYAGTCPTVGNPFTRHLCVSGEPCPDEALRLQGFIASARERFWYASEWLGEEEFEQTIHDLATTELQASRLSRRVSDEGFVREVPIAEDQIRRMESLGASRYGTAIHRRRMTLMKRLISKEARKGLSPWLD